MEMDAERNSLLQAVTQLQNERRKAHQTFRLLSEGFLATFGDVVRRTNQKKNHDSFRKIFLREGACVPNFSSSKPLHALTLSRKGSRQKEIIPISRIAFCGYYNHKVETFVAENMPTAVLSH